MKNEIMEITVSDLRALLFWASVGVAKSRSGSYVDIENILEQYASDIKFKLPYKAFFNSAKVAK